MQPPRGPWPAASSAKAFSSHVDELPLMSDDEFIDDDDGELKIFSFLLFSHPQH